jgi:hypothetical protein
MAFNNMLVLTDTKRAVLSVLTGVAASVLIGCAAVAPPTPEGVVRELATQRWKALMAGDMAKAYEYAAPSYRSVTTLDAYKAQFGGAVNWVGAEVVSVACEAEKCTPVVRIEVKPLLGTKFGNTISTHVDETWLLEDGRWWFFQKL